MRLAPHTAQHLWSFSMDIHEASVPISPAPRYFPRVQRARSLGTFVPVFPKARDLCLQFLSWCTRLSRAQTTTSLPPLLLHLCSRLGRRPFGERSPLSYFPSTFASLEELPVSAQMRLKRDTLGGVFLGAPSALCGSRDCSQGRFRFTCDTLSSTSGLLEKWSYSFQDDQKFRLSR